MKGNPVLIIVTHMRPIVFASLQISKIAAFASWELQASELRIKGLEYKNE
jgi:hypothetical protein